MFALSGVLNRPPGEKRDPAFLDYAVSLAAGDGKKRVCFIPTATGDSPAAMHEAVAMRNGARAWWVEPSVDGGYHDEPIPPRRL